MMEKQVSVSVIVSKGHSRPLAEVSYVRDGEEDRSLLISACHDKQPQIRSGETGNWIGTFHGHKGAVWSAKVDQMTRRLAVTASGDFSAKLWCATTGKEIIEMKHRHVVKSVDFSNDTSKIVSGCQDGLLRIYDTAAPEAPLQELKIGTDLSNAITKCQWMDDEGLVLVGKRSGVVELWDIRESGSTGPALQATLNEDKDPVMDVEFSKMYGIITVAAGSSIFALNSKDLSLRNKIVCPDKMHFREEGGASLHPDGSKIISGGSDLWVREFDANTGEVLRLFKGHHGPVRCVRYHPSGNFVATGSEDATIRIWSVCESGLQ